MRVTMLQDVTPRPRRVAVGEFDGVHLGHRAVIAGSDTVLTFEPHPLAVLRPQAAPKLLTSLERKAELVAELGVQELVVIPFDVAFSQRSAQDFVEHVLIERLRATRVAVGENFRFGHGAEGDPALLRSQPRFETHVTPLVEQEGQTVSSTHIRALIAAGEVAHAETLLGAPFALRGAVVRGDRRGRELGFPTANLVPDPAFVCPSCGVYATRVQLDGTTHLAATNVGTRPTFMEGGALLVEAFLLDFSGDLYGRELTVEFVRRLRGEERFDSVEALIEQMHRDVEQTRSATVPRR